jgi:hydroxymethylglutaryl-CoA lyase
MYLSMAFGNPYGEEWNTDLLFRWVEEMKKRDIRIVSLSNVSIEVQPEIVAGIYRLLIAEFPEIEFGFHLHTRSSNWKANIEAAWAQGCRRFDSVTGGYGGCPMTGKGLLQNLNTRNLLQFLNENNIDCKVNSERFNSLEEMSSTIFASNP